MATQVQINVGRRKESVARVRLVPGTGNVTINGRSMDEYFGRETSKMILIEPLKLVDQLGKVDVLVTANGGGLSGQAGAIRHGISRALVELNAEFRPVLKKAGFLTRDARAVERKKYGRPGARKRFQFSQALAASLQPPRRAPTAGTPRGGRPFGVRACGSGGRRRGSRASKATGQPGVSASTIRPPWASATSRHR